MARPFDPSRRRFLKAGFAGPPARHPPWALDDRFTDGCTRCLACIPACPEAIIRPGQGGLPEVEFANGACSFCGACRDACPEPIFDRSRGRPWAAGARIGEACLALRGVDYQSCRDGCPETAIRFAPAYRKPPQPRIDGDACTGCGACVSVCPAAAIDIVESAPGTRAHA